MTGQALRVPIFNSDVNKDISKQSPNTNAVHMHSQQTEYTQEPTSWPRELQSPCRLLGTHRNTPGHTGPLGSYRTIQELVGTWQTLLQASYSYPALGGHSELVPMARLLPIWEW